MGQLVLQFYREESGASVAEYAILVSLIAVAVIATVLLFRIALNQALGDAVEQIREVMSGSSDS